MRFFYTKSDWVDENTFIYWLEHIVIPYAKKKRTLLVFDSYTAHVSKSFQATILKRNNLDICLILRGMIYLLQPLDVSFNHSSKTIIHNEWKLYLNSQKEEILKVHELSYKESKKPNNNKKIII